MAPIFESELEPNALIDPRLLEAPELNYGLSSSSELEPELVRSLRIELRARAPARTRALAQAQLRQAPELSLELSVTRQQEAFTSPTLGPGVTLRRSRPSSELSSGSELEPELQPELNSGLRLELRPNSKRCLGLKKSSRTQGSI
ncbi:hypothetical protein VE03_09919 [Pseudogymnoascus sp. 23342-1-I1]|nr:hypothetical protein VE03_09919 [Pseudogymnoascus sp. 23342-1-I1]